MINKERIESAVFEDKDDLIAFGLGLEFAIDHIITSKDREMVLRNDLPTRYILDWISEINRRLISF